MGPKPESFSSLESTARLLVRVREGDENARNQLLARYQPILTRWAHRRLPPDSRDMLDTSDLVQMSLIRSLTRLDSFDSRREGSLLSYLRTILLNLIRDEIRRVRRRPGRDPLSPEMPTTEASPLDEAVGNNVLRRYETALSRLPVEQQEAIVMSIEFGCTPTEIAAATGRATPNAARVYVARAMIRLAQEMGTNE